MGWNCKGLGFDFFERGCRDFSWSCYHDFGFYRGLLVVDKKAPAKRKIESFLIYESAGFIFKKCRRELLRGSRSKKSHLDFWSVGKKVKNQSWWKRKVRAKEILILILILISAKIRQKKNKKSPRKIHLDLQKEHHQRQKVDLDHKKSPWSQKAPSTLKVKGLDRKSASVLSKIKN